MEFLFPLSMLGVGLVIGALSVWFITRYKLTSEFATLTERLSGKEAQVRQLREELDRQTAQVAELRNENSRNVAQLSALETKLEDERRISQEKLELLTKAEDKLADAFKALSADALRNNNQSFIDLARQNLEKFQETAKGDLERRQTAIDELVKPLKESLEKVDVKIVELEKTREGAYAELREQVKSLVTSQSQLQSETGNLVKALRMPHVRGRWGEIQLRRVVEMAGMVRYCDFAEQTTVNGEDGRLRPDMVVRLPGNRTIVVDSKVPFDAFYESISAVDETVRASRLKDHARLVRTHIATLSKKQYQEAIQPTPEFVLLFLPGETFYSAALENDPKLIEDGVNQNVIIATPTTLIALLKAISYGWRQEQMAENAHEVSNLARKLYDRLRTFTRHYDTIGRNLDRALDAYNQGVRSLESRVLVTARRFKERGALAGEDIKPIEPVDKTARPLSLDEGGLFPDI
ncbi:MAG TPA: DNA recombination protein RmuC [Pyrinomonadaceae bacterium]|nr:DNA recombination protein RmuC [Pyrinomonadaceae bacterium]